MFVLFHSSILSASAFNEMVGIYVSNVVYVKRFGTLRKRVENDA
jgi:hypothetical protein